MKVEIDGLQFIECFEAFTEEEQTFISDLVAPVSKSTNSLHKNHLQRKVEIDGL